MLTQIFIGLTSMKPILFNQRKQRLEATLKTKKDLDRLNSTITVNSSSSKMTTIAPPKPIIVPNYPPKGPIPILPELEPNEVFPSFEPKRVNKPSRVPDLIPSEPSKVPTFPGPSKPNETRPTKKPLKKPTPQRKVRPKRIANPETDPLKNPEPIEIPSHSPDETRKPKRFRRRRGNKKKVMINLTKFNFTSKQLTDICKKFPIFEADPKSKLKFKPDPEANKIEPGMARGLGRRKSSIAQVKLTSGSGSIMINGKSAVKYLQDNTFLLTRIEAPLYFLQLNDDVSLSIKVAGGGLIGQADAIKLGISRALCNYNMDYRYPLRNKGYLTRDARVKERKKYGLKKARKAPQYSKR